MERKYDDWGTRWAQGPEGRGVPLRKRHTEEPLSWTAIVILVMVVIFIVFMTDGIATAQTPAAPAIAIAKVAEPTRSVIDAAKECVTDMAPILGSRDAARFCRDAMKEENSRIKKVANEAADATKNMHPPAVIVPMQYGGDYYQSYNSGFGGTRVTSCGEGGCNASFGSGGLTFAGPGLQIRPQ